MRKMGVSAYQMLAMAAVQANHSAWQLDNVQRSTIPAQAYRDSMFYRKRKPFNTANRYPKGSPQHKALLANREAKLFRRMKAQLNCNTVKWA